MYRLFVWESQLATNSHESLASSRQGAAENNDKTVWVRGKQKVG